MIGIDREVRGFWNASGNGKRLKFSIKKNTGKEKYRVIPYKIQPINMQANLSIS